MRTNERLLKHEQNKFEHTRTHTCTYWEVSITYRKLRTK